jgi:GntR family transcriptional regulator, transcriptional repressor for pyruvate dehydrogenase complex
MSNIKRASAPNVIDRMRVADQILKALRERIVSGELQTGSKLPTERELAEQYRVSGPTVREAIRGLSAMGLVDVRHGSGAYVTASVQSIVAATLGTVIQLEGLGATAPLTVGRALDEQAASLAAEFATRDDCARMRASLAELDAADTAKAAATAVRGLHGAIATASHNPLLAALCIFLSDLQAELGLEMTGDSLKEWTKILSKLKPTRVRLVNAITRGDRAEAAAMARHLHVKAVELITAQPRAKEFRMTDPQLKGVMLRIMNRMSSH